MTRSGFGRRRQDPMQDPLRRSVAREPNRYLRLLGPALVAAVGVLLRMNAHDLALDHSD